MLVGSGFEGVAGFEGVSGFEGVVFAAAVRSLYVVFLAGAAGAAFGAAGAAFGAAFGAGAGPPAAALAR